MRRLLAFLFACGHYSLVVSDEHAWMGVYGPCMRRAYHKGPHEIPAGTRALHPEEKP